MVYYDVKIKYTLKEAFYTVNGEFWYNNASPPKLR